MAEESKIVLSSEDKSLGTIQISPRVLEIIAGIAASEIDGVSKMYGSFANSVSELLGRSDRRRGVKLSSNDEKLSLDVDVYVEYGVSVPKVAAMIQDKVKQQITLMNDLKVKVVNVHIKGIVKSKEDHKVDANDLFGEQLNDEAGE